MTEIDYCFDTAAVQVTRDNFSDLQQQQQQNIRITKKK